MLSKNAVIPKYVPDEELVFSAKTYAKTKELGPVGEAGVLAAPPGSANVIVSTETI